MVLKPPEAHVAGRQVPVAQTPPAVSVCLTTLRKRADFLRAAKALRSGQPGFLLQARDRGDNDPTIRVGYTCSKKLGNAVIRNKAKRRLREIAREAIPNYGQPGWDYVLVGRPGDTISRNFSDLQDDLRRALRKLAS